MAPLWYTGFTLTLLVQVTFGVNPLDSILSATVEKVLQGMEARLAQHEHLIVEQIEAMEVRLLAKTDALKASLVDNKATMETRFAGQTVELEMRLAQHNRGMGVALEGLKASLAGSVSFQLGVFEERVIEDTEARLNDHLANTNHTIGALLLGMKDTIINEIKKPATTTECRPKEDYVTSNCTIGGILHDLEETLLNDKKSVLHTLEARLSSETLLLHRTMNETKSLVHGLKERVTSECRYITKQTDSLMRESLVHSNTTETLLREILVHSTTTESQLRESLNYSNTTESLLRETLVHCNTTESLMIESLVHYNTTKSLLRESLDCSNTTKSLLRESLVHFNQTISGLLLNLEERMIGETHNGTNATVTELENDFSQINETVRARLDSLEARLSALCSSRDSQELVPIIHKRSNTQLQILTLLESCVEITFLRRVDGSVDFIRNWANYTYGFGNESGEFWLGLKTLHQLTTQHQYSLRVDMEDWSGQTKWAQYQTFRVGSESANYVLTVTGYNPASTTAGDSMAHHNGAAFSTYDKDNDRAGNNCASDYKSGWWYNACYSCNPTGQYQPAGYRGYHGIRWSHAYNDDRSFKSMTLKLTAN